MYRYLTCQFTSNGRVGVVDHYDSGDLLVADVRAEWGFVPESVYAAAAAYDKGEEVALSVTNPEPGSSCELYLACVTYAEAVEG